MKSFQHEPQRIGSSGKGIGLCNNPMRSNVRISLSANNSLWLTRRQSRSIPDPCGEEALHESEVYLTGKGTQSGPTLEGFLVIPKKKKKKVSCTKQETISMLQISFLVIILISAHQMNRAEVSALHSLKFKTLRSNFQVIVEIV